MMAGSVLRLLVLAACAAVAWPLRFNWRLQASRTPSSADAFVGRLDGGRERFKEMMTSERVVAFKFFAPWCRACRGMKPGFARLAEKLAKDGQPVAFYDVNVADEDCKELVLDLEIRALPYVAVFVDGGGPVHAAPCGMSKVPKLAEKLDEILASLPAEAAIAGAAAEIAHQAIQGGMDIGDDVFRAFAGGSPNFITTSPLRKPNPMANELKEWNRFRLVLASTRAFVNSPWNARLQSPEFREAAVQRLSAGQKREFRAAFNALDLDGSGLISIHELEAALQQVGVKPKGGATLQRTMEMAGTSGAGEMDFDAFLAMMACDALYQDTISPMKSSLVDAFSRFEAQPGSGFVSSRCIRQGLASLDPPLHLSEAAAEALVQEFDIDGDGQINFYEFVRMLAVNVP
mmetsp:Transcript_45059/g.141140  ORF Transcript_45059/g.141140 Transcript_45059/m.141140 type:complete len:403 (-) Transcript_45059:490-1698(-)